MEGLKRVIEVVFLAGTVGGLGFFALDESGEGDSDGHRACLARANQGSELTKADVEVLCAGASSLHPAGCYLLARHETALTQAEALKLCRCARSLVPVRCFGESKEFTELPNATIIERCRAIRAQRLHTDCTPRDETPAITPPPDEPPDESLDESPDDVETPERRLLPEEFFPLPAKPPAQTASAQLALPAQDDLRASGESSGESHEARGAHEAGGAREVNDNERR